MKKKKRKGALKPILIILVIALVIFGGYRYYHTRIYVKLPVEVYYQYPDYPTGCESASLYMLLRYYDVDVTMEEIVEALPKGPTPYEVDGVLYGANPEKEFVGDPRDSSSYGVYNEPIKVMADLFKEGAISVTGATTDDIKRIVSTGNPVIVWYTTNISSGVECRREWLDYETGETVQWPAYEHAVVVYGYNAIDNVLYYMDSNVGSSVTMGWDWFETTFNELGGRIVYYDE
ncbi:MAG: C39 family peptidase [Oscillospiraceae bacterium]|nr:C39 family peptidase [Oscillospiraceae bacterium]